MPNTEITLQMCIDEMQRTVNGREVSYKELVSKGKLSPYTRDHRQHVMGKILKLLKQAKADRSQTFVQLINTLP